MALPDQPPDPHGALAWINAVLETLKQAYAALVVPLGALVLWMVKRKDRAQERADARQKSEDEAHQRIADQLDREGAERFEAIRQENKDLRALVALKDAEITRLLALARRWWDVARNTWHEGNNRIQALCGLMERKGLAIPDGMAIPPVSHDPDRP